ncbi:flagellar basal body-associated FliL family protein [Sulfitobacter geojensis]|uniref:flagellar basal body-associated FliL family protein n=1 Tax=Sulfitobacter geojensis TaxID=1342299 RepID=UPI00249185ED|nr:flagellar basal body-associated FliL family protein [Sulfitobacter geojensis]
MAAKPDPKKKSPEAGAEDAEAQKSRGSRKTLLAAAVMCLVSLGGGFFLARAAYLQDAEEYAPEYKEAETADAHEEQADAHGGDAKKGGAKLREDLTDPLAKDGHDAEKAMALQPQDEGDGHSGAAVDSGLLDLGDMLTNIQSVSPQGTPDTAFLKINLVIAYRPDAEAGALMEERQPFIRDLFNSYLRGLSEADLRGMGGIMYVKAELLKRARAAVGNDLPQEILIKDLIVQ